MMMAGVKSDTYCALQPDKRALMFVATQVRLSASPRFQSSPRPVSQALTAPMRLAPQDGR